MQRLFSNHTGVVLRVYVHKNKIALLDAVLGRIDVCFFAGDTISAGTVLQYDLNKYYDTYVMASWEMVSVPLLLGKTDIGFLHTLLELCYYSVRLGSVDAEVFTIIMFLYTDVADQWSVHTKKIIMAKLLISIGVYMDHIVFAKPAIIRLCATPIDKIFDETIDLNCIQDIDELLRCCLAGHPYADQFKAVKFLYKEAG